MNVKSIKEVKDYYDQNVIGKLRGFVYGNKRVEAAWTEMNNWVIKPTNILEVGCGIGDISWRFASKFPGTKVIGFDVSEKSIEIATQLFSNPNVKFLQADDISFLDTHNVKYDLIYLVDVYEHIPVELRPNLFAFIRKTLSDGGTVFISCPTIAHQNFLKLHQPSGLQPVDEDISVREVVEFSEQTNVPLLYYKEVSVWNTGDYLHAVFGFRQYKPILQINNVIKHSFKKKIYQKIVNKKISISPDLSKERLELLVNKIDKEIYTLLLNGN